MRNNLYTDLGSFTRAATLWFLGGILTTNRTSNWMGLERLDQFTIDGCGQQPIRGRPACRIKNRDSNVVHAQQSKLNHTPNTLVITVFLPTLFAKWSAPQLLSLL